uniref:Uncharacterized protein n=1 Tax=Bosea sp. NBC_00436 TaxID=2969620 RepID=A0A9E7ZVM9_9HYPH
MWNPHAAPAGDLGNMVLEPVEVLYEYDGPVIFRAKAGLVDLLLSKISEHEKVSRYLSCTTNNDSVEALKSGRLSVYGALDRDSFWIIDIDAQARVQRYWNCARDDVPGRFFPKPGLGLFHWQGAVPDTLEQSSAILALKFRGAELTEHGIPLGKLKELIDQTFSTIRKILTPPQLANTRSSTFDVEVAPLKFASLVIAIKEPVINMQAIGRIKSLRKYTKEDIEAEVRARSGEFVRKLQEVSMFTRTGIFHEGYAEANFVFLDTLSELLPDENGTISSIEFNGPTEHGTATVIFDQKASDIVRKLSESTRGKSVTETGFIAGMMIKAQTIKITSLRGKDVTCVFSHEYYDKLLENERFKVRSRVKLKGQLTRRPRVDLMQVDEIEFIDDFNLFD